MPPKRVPKPPERDPYSTVGLAKALVCACRNAALFASDDEARPVLTCVALDADAERVRFVSTDSYVLLVQELQLDAPETLDHPWGRDPWSAVVQADDLTLLRAVLHGVKTTPVDLTLSAVGLVASVGGRDATIPLWDEDSYPDWEKLGGDGELEQIDRMAFSTHTLQRMGALRLPSVKGDLTVQWKFASVAKPVAFTVTDSDDYLKIRGLAAPCSWEADF